MFPGIYIPASHDPEAILTSGKRWRDILFKGGDSPQKVGGLMAIGSNLAEKANNRRVYAGYCSNKYCKAVRLSQILGNLFDF